MKCELNNLFLFWICLLLGIFNLQYHQTVPFFIMGYQKKIRKHQCKI